MPGFEYNARGGKWGFSARPSAKGEKTEFEQNFGGGGAIGEYQRYGFGKDDLGMLATLDPESRKAMIAQALLGRVKMSKLPGAEEETMRNMASVLGSSGGLSGTPEQIPISGGKSSGGFQVSKNSPPTPVFRRIAESLAPERRPTRDWPVMIEARRAGPTAAGSGTSGVKRGGSNRENTSQDLTNALLQQQIDAYGRSSKKEGMEMDLQGRNLRNYDEDRRLKLEEMAQIAKQRELDMMLGRRSADATDEANRLRALDQEQVGRQRNFNMEQERNAVIALEAERRRQMLLGILGSLR